MNTQLQLLVKKESLMSRAVGGNSWLGPLAILGKRPLELILDGESQSLLPSSTPYVFDLTPGVHTMQIIDPKKKRKQKENKKTAVMVGAMFGLAAGAAGGGSGLLGALSGADAAKGMVGSVSEDGTVELTLAEGDILKLSCRANKKGIVNVKPMK